MRILSQLFAFIEHHSVGVGSADIDTKPEFHALSSLRSSPKNLTRCAPSGCDRAVNRTGVPIGVGRLASKNNVSSTGAASVRTASMPFTVHLKSSS